MTSEDRFYDRKGERENIPKQIRCNNNQSQIIVLAGTTGVGKSSLAQKLLRDNLSDYKSVTVHIGKSSVGTIENLSYFNALYKSLTERASERKEYAIKTAKQHGLLNFFNWLRIISGAIKNYFNLDPNRHISEPTEEYSVSRKKDYIISVLKKGPFIIDVENIQNIDMQSTELFQSLLEDITPLIWILEYTLPAGGIDSQFYSFAGEWQETKALWNVYEIHKLDFDLAFNLAPKEIQNPKNKERLKLQYENSHGNLLTIMVVPSNLDENDNFIKSRLESLNQDEKYIVYILYLHEEPISESMLFSILTKADKQISFSYSKASEILQRLIKDKIVVQRVRSYCIKHDSLITALSQMLPEPTLFLAYRTLEHYYRELRTEALVDKTNRVYHLFSLYVKFHDENLTKLFPELWDIVLATKYPGEIIQKIEWFKQETLQDSKADIHIIYSVTKFLAEVCIKLQYSKEAQENLDLAYNIRPSQYIVGLQGAIYALDNTSENWGKLNSLLLNTEKGTRLWLSLCLCRVHMVMRSSNGWETKAYIEKLLSNSRYVDYPEYGFLIYNYAEFAETPMDGLLLYKKAFQDFGKYNLANMQAEVMISMSMSFGYMGQLKNARKAIQEAQKLAPMHISEEILLNNIAVITILEGKTDISVVNQLADAALVCVNPYEKFIIRSNWLVSLTLCNYMTQAINLAVEIETENFEIYQYEDFLHIVYQNLHFFYSKISDAEKVSYYEQKLSSLAAREGINQWTKSLIQSMLQRKRIPNNYYSRFPFRVDFLGFWGLEISNDLENFQ